MDIVLVTGGFPLRSQSFIVAKAVGLARRGHRVTVLAGGPGDHRLDPDVVTELGPRLRVEYRRRRSSAAGARPAARVGAGADAVLALAGALRREPRLLGRQARALHARHGFGGEGWRRLERGLPVVGRRADVVHFEWATKAARCSELLDLLTTPVVVSCRGTDVAVMAPADERLAADLRRVFERADAVHCVSEAVADAAETLGLDRSRVFVNHPAVDTGWFTPPPTPAPTAEPMADQTATAAVRIVSVGRLHPVKAYGDALGSIRALLDRGHDVRYTIVGGGDQEATATVQASIRTLGLDDRVVLDGALPREEVRRRLWDSDVFLLSSISEGLSNSALEAMAASLPVVSTAVGGMPEAIRDGIDGYLVPPRDPAAMADALERLVVDPDRRVKVGWQARQRACESFDLERQLDRLEALYERLAAGARPRSGQPR